MARTAGTTRCAASRYAYPQDMSSTGSDSVPSGAQDSFVWRDCTAQPQTLQDLLYCTEAALRLMTPRKCNDCGHRAFKAMCRTDDMRSLLAKNFRESRNPTREAI